MLNTPMRIAPAGSGFDDDLLTTPCNFDARRVADAVGLS